MAKGDSKPRQVAREGEASRKHLEEICRDYASRGVRTEIVDDRVIVNAGDERRWSKTTAFSRCQRQAQLEELGRDFRDLPATANLFGPRHKR